MKHRGGGVIVSVSGGCHGGVGLVFIERDGPFNHAVDFIRLFGGATLFNFNNVICFVF